MGLVLVMRPYGLLGKPPAMAARWRRGAAAARAAAAVGRSRWPGWRCS